ncbi:hypothetical protein OHB04_19970 [Streptomyces sp. NBC_01775]|uniref:hypothetical protein n=1 Tax=Streptomyces sp. NBC_01775 TaxID=2975939 RepID=UPI002DDC3989|nr:hypothetical protein [Streptomyces sp. NBC_01775]WSB77824.1 hypothetical protein OHB04_19970 [Streptomyces sp. NBC_01775]
MRDGTEGPERPADTAARYDSTAARHDSTTAEHDSTADIPGRRPRRRQLGAVAWVCAVAAAFLLGAWSFSHADPGGQYGRPEPLTEAGVQHELSQAQQRAATRSAYPESTRKPEEPTSSPHPSRPTSRTSTSTVRFPDGLGTAVAECRTDARTVKLLSWSPAEGYSADDVEPGPAPKAGVELEPAADDADDHTVIVRCAQGKPHAAYEREDADDD